MGGGDEGDHGCYGDSDGDCEGDASHGDGDEPRRCAHLQPLGGGVYAEGVDAGDGNAVGLGVPLLLHGEPLGLGAQGGDVK